jgi:hypothetical protein
MSISDRRKYVRAGIYPCGGAFSRMAPDIHGTRVIPSPNFTGNDLRDQFFVG